MVSSSLRHNENAIRCRELRAFFEYVEPSLRYRATPSSNKSVSKFADSLVSFGSPSAGINARIPEHFQFMNDRKKAAMLS
jgi:hypothetical protein